MAIEISKAYLAHHPQYGIKLNVKPPLPALPVSEPKEQEFCKEEWKWSSPEMTHLQLFGQKQSPRGRKGGNGCVPVAGSIIPQEGKPKTF